ncbi:MAG: ATP-binding cassette domain-containing protein, partial [Myxococcota bacterium]|nr:ATP-binding cassette domain-containing protein [Myxococcota bacterium]
MVISDPSAQDIPPVVEARSVSVSFDGHDVLRELNLSVKPGEHTLVFGPSGSGKSTLLHLMGRLLPPGGGELFFQGTGMDQLGDPRSFRRRHVGFIFQEFHLLESLTVFQNIDMVAKASGRDDINVSGLLEPLGLVSRQHDVVKILSRGERQRVSIARAFANGPQLLLADEPTASLDPSNRQRTMDHLFALCEQTGATALIVSHDLALQALPQVRRSLRLEEGALHPS